MDDDDMLNNKKYKYIEEIGKIENYKDIIDEIKEHENNNFIHVFNHTSSNSLALHTGPTHTSGPTRHADAEMIEQLEELRREVESLREKVDPKPQKFSTTTRQLDI